MVQLQLRNVNIGPRYRYRTGSVPSVWYLRHETEFSSWLDPFPFLDIVSRDCSLSAHRVPRSVPVWVLKGQNNKNIALILQVVNISVPLRCGVTCRPVVCVSSLSASFSSFLTYTSLFLISALPIWLSFSSKPYHFIRNRSNLISNTTFFCGVKCRIWGRVRTTWALWALR